MPRITLVFRLSSIQIQQDLLHELSMHDDLAASAGVADGEPVLRVEVNDVPAATWEVRATVGAFDELATEIPGQG